MEKYFYFYTAHSTVHRAQSVRRIFIIGGRTAVRSECRTTRAQTCDFKYNARSGPGRTLKIRNNNARTDAILIIIIISHAGKFAYIFKNRAWYTYIWQDKNTSGTTRAYTYINTPTHQTCKKEREKAVNLFQLCVPYYYIYDSFSLSTGTMSDSPEAVTSPATVVR